MSDVIRLRLTPEQVALLTPLAIKAASRHENAVFLAVTVPKWSPEGTVWEMQAVTISAELGLKVKRLILGGSNP